MAGRSGALSIKPCGSRIHLDHPNAGRSVVQDHSSDHRFKRLHLTRASVRRASGFVLTGYAEVKALLSELLTIPESGSYSAWVRLPR